MAEAAAAALGEAASAGRASIISGSAIKAGIGVVGGLGTAYGIGKSAESNVKGNCETDFGDNGVADFFSGFAHGFLSIAGLGGTIDPASQLQSKLSDAQTSLQNMYNGGSIVFANTQVKIDSDFIRMLNTNRNYLGEMIQLITTITNENLGRTNITLVAISLLSFVIVLYILL